MSVYDVNETSIHYLIRQSKQQSKLFVEADGSAPETVASAAEVMAIVFRAVHGVVLIGFLRKGQNNHRRIFRIVIEESRCSRKKLFFTTTTHPITRLHFLPRNSANFT